MKCIILKSFGNNQNQKNNGAPFGTPYFYNTRKIAHPTTGLTCGTDRGVNSTGPYKIPISSSSINIHIWQ